MSLLNNTSFSRQEIFSRLHLYKIYSVVNLLKGTSISEFFAHSPEINPSILVKKHFKLLFGDCVM